jgi:hypothetical protein
MLMRARVEIFPAMLHTKGRQSPEPVLIPVLESPVIQEMVQPLGVQQGIIAE